MLQMYLSIQGSYQTLKIALYNNEKQVDAITLHSMRASAQFIPEIKRLLSRHGILLADLAFIAIDQGPGAFTSLRVAITYVNSFAFAANVPLIGIDGLDGLAQETHAYTDAHNLAAAHIAVLLNAYGGEVYLGLYAISGNKLDYVIAPKNYSIARALEFINQHCAHTPVIFSGNGVAAYQEEIESVRSVDDFFLHETLSVCSTQHIAQEGRGKFEKEEMSSKLLPHYLKEQTFAVRKQRG